MDPNAALRELLDAIDADDAYAIEEYTEALQTWAASGGYLPTCFSFRGDGLAEKLFRHFLDFSASHANRLRGYDL